MHHLTSREARRTHFEVAGERTDGDSEVIKRAITRAQGGCPHALRFLYIYYAPEVLHYVRKLVHDDYEAEDIAQEVFMKLISVIGKYETREVPFGAWIRRVARNVAMDHLRTRRSVPCEDIRVRDDERTRISRERCSDLRKALSGLPKKQRDVMVLRHVLGLTPVEIAGILGQSEGSIHGLHHRGRVGLQSALLQLGAAPVVAVRAAA